MSCPSRRLIDSMTYADEPELVAELIKQAAISHDTRKRISERAIDLVQQIRKQTQHGLMEVFLAQYGLSTSEGVALMCLAEALLRVLDAATIDALIEDKIAPSDWSKHLGHSSSSLVNASTWALLLTSKVLQGGQPGIVGALRGAIKRLGEPVIRIAVISAMKELGKQFVLGETIENALVRARSNERRGYSYSYDMLGEAAKTNTDALRYHMAYSHAISVIAKSCTGTDIRDNPGISVKLSALHPRYELSHRNSVMNELVPRLRSLALLAKSAGIGLNIDAEEADRLSLSMDIVEAVISKPDLAGWDGFGVVVQTYGKRAGATIDYLYELTCKLDRRIMVRLVKGAYWDTEIKQAQVLGMDSFSVFTSKWATDINYIANVQKLLGMTNRIYPQFATHNAHTISTVLEIVDDLSCFEFQRLHGMGESIHDIVQKVNGTRCRIYAPVGAYSDLLAYLVRRLLENGANSSFVNQIVDHNVPPERVARDPFEAIVTSSIKIPKGTELFLPERANSKGFDLRDVPTVEAIDIERKPFRTHQWHATPLMAGQSKPEAARPITSPFDPNSIVGTVAHASLMDVNTALSSACVWDVPIFERTKVLMRAADMYEAHYGAFFALLAREAGKTPLDAVAELRETTDFLRYYAANAPDSSPAGIFTCISPWNFPLAIFTGQIAAALAAGNAVLAKPADQTPLIAFEAIKLLHQAGVPREVLQLLPGTGAEVGTALTSDSRVNGIVFTGSTATAQHIRSVMAANLAPGSSLIAETGGLNAMIIDSTILPEQALTAISESAFQSAGQRCSALRCLYIQEDISENFLEMLKGVMQELRLGDPWEYSTDCGPVIDKAALNNIAAYIAIAQKEGRILFQIDVPDTGFFIGPTLIKVNSIRDLKREIFGPVLHFATFRADELDNIIDDINNTGYGLTFGLQTRINDRVQHICDRVHAGNIYVNRNQIGAIVGSQPFGGEGLSGTGPKAGGPYYLSRFLAHSIISYDREWNRAISKQDMQMLIDKTEIVKSQSTISLPGPTGESNRLSTFSRLPFLCLGPSAELASEQSSAVRKLGGTAVKAHGMLPPDVLKTLTGFAGVIWWGDIDTARDYNQALARRDGPILPLLISMPDEAHVRAERHVCIDTTSAGGNVALLGMQDE